MANSDEPIYDFSLLKSFLTRKGYVVGTRDTYEPFIPEDVRPEDVSNGSMEFRNDGIFSISSSGNERQVFLYMKRYHIQQFGLPRFHICKCQTIEAFIASGGFKSHYVKANTVPVPVIDLDDSYIEKEIPNLPLCSNCRSMIKANADIDFDTNASAEKFVEMLKKSNNEAENENQEVDLFGYVKNWEFISKKFREEKNYTCENCGLQITNLYYRQYIHVHHINGNKLNNNYSNLICLCLYCHAHVDDHHLKRLTTGANGIVYRDFYNKYKIKGFWNAKNYDKSDDDGINHDPLKGPIV